MPLTPSFGSPCVCSMAKALYMLPFHGDYQFLKAGLWFVKDAFLTPNTHHSKGTEQLPLKLSFRHGKTGKQYPEVTGPLESQWLSWLRKGPSGARKLWVLLFGESLLSSVLQSQNGEGPCEAYSFWGAKKLSGSLPVGMGLGPGHCLLWETVNKILLLKTRLASDQVVPSQFHREKILPSHRPWVWEFLAPIWPLGSVHQPGLQFNGFCLEALWNNSLAGRCHP